MNTTQASPATIPDLHEAIVRFAAEAHQRHWRMTGQEGAADRLAALVTSTWQTSARALAPERLVAEFQIADGLNERIDLVDVVAGTAYELKVSPNNVHMEFYRDIFKVLVARDNKLPDLKKFVFLTPKSAAARLSRGLGAAVIRDAPRLGLVIEVVGL